MKPLHSQSGRIGTHPSSGGCYGLVVVWTVTLPQQQSHQLSHLQPRCPQTATEAVRQQREQKRILHASLDCCQRSRWQQTPEQALLATSAVCPCQCRQPKQKRTLHANLLAQDSQRSRWQQTPEQGLATAAVCPCQRRQRKQKRTLHANLLAQNSQRSCWQQTPEHGLATAVVHPCQWSQREQKWTTPAVG